MKRRGFLGLLSTVFITKPLIGETKNLSKSMSLSPTHLITSYPKNKNKNLRPCRFPCALEIINSTGRNLKIGKIIYHQNPDKTIDDYIITKIEKIETGIYIEEI